MQPLAVGIAKRLGEVSHQADAIRQVEHVTVVREPVVESVSFRVEGEHKGRPAWVGQQLERPVNPRMLDALQEPELAVGGPQQRLSFLLRVRAPRQVDADAPVGASGLWMLGSEVLPTLPLGKELLQLVDPDPAMRRRLADARLVHRLGDREGQGPIDLPTAVRVNPGQVSDDTGEVVALRLPLDGVGAEHVGPSRRIQLDGEVRV